MANELPIIKTPQDFVALFLQNPEVCGEGLKELLDVTPDIFSMYVPQVIDKQTGLLSKDYFEEHELPLALLKARTNEVPLSYFLTDLDGFHNFNEDYGHIMGDEAIKQVTDLLKKSFRTKNTRQTLDQTLNQEDNTSKSNRMLDHVGRVSMDYTPQGRVGGGEEFAVILYGCDERNAEIVANRFLAKIRALTIPYRIDEALSITVSGGISQYQENMEPRTLIERADRALFYSKDQGKDIVTRFSLVPSDFVPKPRKRV
ncbi:MAG: GGDEF domain-containing protein [Nanoarchaeota archaeon]|mgnify:CR=1 FL=1